MPKIGFLQSDYDGIPDLDRQKFQLAHNNAELEIVMANSVEELPKKSDFYFEIQGAAWVLSCSSQDWAPLKIDFDSRRARQRFEDPLRWRDPLAKACALTPKNAGSKILDLTAGLGGDSAAMAYLGAQVIAVERSIVLYFLLKDGLGRSESLSKNFILEWVTAEAKLNSLSLSGEKFDVIYLDPMFSTEKKKALPPREMQYLRKLLGEEPAGVTHDLLERALKTSVKRVVMKNSLKAEVHPKRNFVVEGKSHRFDVFLKT